MFRKKVLVPENQHLIDVKIDLRGIQSKGTVCLPSGEMYVVPKGVMHKPSAENECKVMLVGPCGVVNTGAAERELTAENDVWI
jgi:mannose-6-phosphate isomerase-like protein (cupin superfamily)